MRGLRRSRIAVHVAMRTDFDEDQVAVGGGDAIDQRRIESAQIGNVADGNERRGHVQGDHRRQGQRQPSRAGETKHDPGERRRAEERQHVLDAIEHRARFGGIEAQQQLRQHRGRRIETHSRPAAAERQHDQRRQPHVGRAPVVVEPAVREDENLDVVIDGAREQRPVERRAGIVNRVVEADVGRVAKRFPVHRQRDGDRDGAGERQPDERRAIAEVAALEQEVDAGVDDERDV